MKIKTLLSAAIIIAITVSGFSQVQMTTSNVNPDVTKAIDEIKSVDWDKTIYDFEEIEQGTPRSVTFEFKNVSDVPVVISSVRASCGCTATDYTREPVLPGKKATVKATYNATKLGFFQKNVTVNANTPKKSYLLQIKGTVIAKP